MLVRSLMYHDVTGPGDAVSGFPGAGAAHYKLTRARFVEHLDALCAAVPERFSRYDRLFDGAVLLTFDDGGSSAHDVIAPELERRSVCGHFFVTSDCVGQAGFVTREKLRELHRRRHVIGSHSASHPARISALPDAALAEEWRRSVDTLSDVIGEPVRTASVPGGYHSRRVAEAAERAGIRYLFTSEPVASVERLGSLRVFGRYAIVSRTPAHVAARLALGAHAVTGSQWALWNAKKVVKQLAWPVYESTRSLLLRRVVRAEVAR